jgi:lysophospholipase L1-like esterase
MIKLKNKTIKTSLIVVSISLNVLFLGYGVNKAHWKYNQSKTKRLIELEMHNINLTHPQPDTVKYIIARNKVFEILPKDTNEVIMLGNSLTHHFEWNEIFKNVNIKNRGIMGDISKGVLQRLDNTLESKPKKIFIEVGINDLLAGFAIDSVFKNYVSIIQTIKLKSPKTRIYMQNILPTNWFIYDTHVPVINRICILNNQLKIYCNDNKITFIDLYSNFQKNNSLNPKYDCGDHLHLSGAGYLLWCSLIKNYIYEK